MSNSSFKSPTVFHSQYFPFYAIIRSLKCLRHSLKCHYVSVVENYKQWCQSGDIWNTRGSAGVTVERRCQSSVSIFTQDRLERLSLAASLLNGHPLFKSLWSECVSQPLPSPLPRTDSQATYTTALAMRSDRPQGKKGIIGGTGTTNGLFVLSEQIKMFICPCLNLLGLFLNRRKI